MPSSCSTGTAITTPSHFGGNGRAGTAPNLWPMAVSNRTLCRNGGRTEIITETSSSSKTRLMTSTHQPVAASAGCISLELKKSPNVRLKPPALWQRSSRRCHRRHTLVENGTARTSVAQPRRTTPLGWRYPHANCSHAAPGRARTWVHRHLNTLRHGSPLHPRCRRYVQLQRPRSWWQHSASPWATAN